MRRQTVRILKGTIVDPFHQFTMAEAGNIAGRRGVDYFDLHADPDVDFSGIIGQGSLADALNAAGARQLDVDVKSTLLGWEYRVVFIQAGYDDGTFN